MTSPDRGPYQGVGQILRYNAPAFGGALAAALGAAAAMAAVPPAWPWLRGGLAAFAALVLLGAFVSLAVSHWVYDRSGLFRWDWLSRRLEAPRTWAVLHAGLDEVSPALRRLYPDARGDVLDLYDAREMTEPSIRRARRSTTPPEPARPASADALPLDDGAVDLLMLFFAAHELRRPRAREALFAELARALGPGGRVVLVEHLRDLPNLLAFGPGAFHFLPRKEWDRLAAAAGLQVRDECALTPFVRAFFLARPA